MTVKFYPPKKSSRGSAISTFLLRYKVQHELIRPEEMRREGAHLFRFGEVPVVEVDGQLFVDPNEDALKKILHVG